MTKTVFYLIRHGETVWNKEGKYQGWTDIELSDKGLEQAKLLGRRFQNIPVDAVYASPLKRAVETARPIAETAGVPIITDEHFKEINFGIWEGGTVQTLSEQYGKEFTDFFSDPFTHPFPGDGSFSKVADRAVKGFELLVNQYEGKKVVIVSHGGLLRILIIKLMGMDTGFYRKLWLNNTAISTIEVHNGNYLLMTLNDKAHIENTEFI